MEHLDRHRTAFRIAGEVDHPHTAFPEAVLKAIRAEGPRQVFRRRHRGFQSTKQIACCGANKMLPICNVAAGTSIDQGQRAARGTSRALGAAESGSRNQSMIARARSSSSGRKCE